MTREQVNEIRRDLIGDLKNRVQEIYLEYQKGLGIKYGDQPPKLAADEEMEIAALANTIAETLMFQKGE